MFEIIENWKISQIENRRKDSWQSLVESLSCSFGRGTNCRHYWYWWYWSSWTPGELLPDRVSGILVRSGKYYPKQSRGSFFGWSPGFFQGGVSPQQVFFVPHPRREGWPFTPGWFRVFGWAGAPRFFQRVERWRGVPDQPRLAWLRKWGVLYLLHSPGLQLWSHSSFFPPSICSWFGVFLVWPFPSRPPSWVFPPPFIFLFFPCAQV